MKTITTDCHECHLENIEMPAVVASADGDFYCSRHQEASGLDPALLLTIPQYLEMHGYSVAPPLAIPTVKAPREKKPKKSAAPKSLGERIEEYNGGPVEEPPQPKEDEMPKLKQEYPCACGCGEMCGKEGGRARGHWTKIGATKKSAPTKLRKSSHPRKSLQAENFLTTHVSASPDVAAPPRKIVAIALELDEEQLDAWWNGLPFESRGVLFQHFFAGIEAR